MRFNSKIIEDVLFNQTLKYPKRVYSSQMRTSDVIAQGLQRFGVNDSLGAVKTQNSRNQPSFCKYAQKI